MKRLLVGVILTVLLVIFYCLIVWFQVNSLWRSVDLSSKNISSRETITLAVPKEARVGEEFEVEVFYSPQFAYKFELSNILFLDSSGAYDDKGRVELSREVDGKWVYPYTLGSLPRYLKFKYVISPESCPEKIVYTTCRFVETKKGLGSIRLTYYPESRFLIGGEGYQGEGEFIFVPVEIK